MYLYYTCCRTLYIKSGFRHAYVILHKTLVTWKASLSFGSLSFWSLLGSLFFQEKTGGFVSTFSFKMLYEWVFYLDIWFALEDFPDFAGCIQGSPQSANVWLKQPKHLVTTGQLQLCLKLSLCFRFFVPKLVTEHRAPPKIKATISMFSL